MNLKEIIARKGKKNSEEYFWSLTIEPSWVQAAIWKVEEGKVTVPYRGTPTAWELDKDLINAVDTALSSAIQNFPEDAKEPSKTVFGVISSWALGGQIKDEYLNKIKKICSDLSLTPLGFVVLPEAIAHFIKSKEGSPATAILLGVYKQNIEVSIFKLGSLIGSSSIARSVSIVDDVAEGLSRFVGSVDPIPSRFIIYDGKEGELEEVRQSLIKVTWEDYSNLKFLHTPKIEIIESEKKVAAVSIAGAMELVGAGVETSDTQKVTKADEKKLDQPPSTKPEDVGFALEEDVAVKTSEEKVKQTQQFSQEEIEQSLDNIRQPADVDNRNEGKTSPLGKISTVFSNLKLKVSASLSKLNIFKGVGTGSKKIFFTGAAFLILVIVGGFAWWWYYPKATVTIYVSSRSLRERVNLSVDPSVESTNFSERLLKGNLLELEVEGEKSLSTTGDKTVGEKAKGEVTIYRVGATLTLASGTTLTGPNNMKFVLDEQVEVASGSASSPSSTKTKITAEDIGSQHNLASDASFTISNYSVSDLEAKNESSFSGGSSREIQVVTNADQERLLEELEEELRDKALEELTNKVTEQKLFIDQSIETEIISKSYSNKVGDEATSLSLELTLSAKALSVDVSEMSQISIELLKDKVPDGFVLREDQTEVNFEFNNKQGDLYLFTGNVEANLLPEVKVEEVRSAIRGKYPSIAKDYLTKEVPGFVRAEIVLKPKLPSRLNSLPKVADNIEIEISAER